VREALETGSQQAEERVAAARSDAERELRMAREQAEERLEAERAELTRQQEEAIAAERARASVTSHELRSARAEIENLRRELETARRVPPARAQRITRAPDTDETQVVARDERPPRETLGWDDNDDDRTEPVATATQTAEAEAEPETAPDETANGGWREQDGEGIRVLHRRGPRPRHTSEDETEPEELAPGATATGARLLEPAHGSPASQTTRLMAVVALGVAMLAALLVILGVGLF
jgi:hypothetical protein